MSRKVSATTKYVRTTHYSDRDGTVYIGTRRGIQPNNYKDNVKYTVKQGDRIDLLAKRFYNNPDMYWIITDFNDLQDPLISLTPGTELIIPSLERIKKDLL